MSISGKKYNSTLYELISTYRDLALCISHVVKPLVEDVGLTMFQFRLLVCLYEGGTNLTELAERVHAYKGYTSSAVDVLVAAHLVTRQYPESDRRSVYLEITDDGKHVLDQILDTDTPFYQRLSSAFQLSETELQRLIALHRNVISNLVDGRKECL
ncbi:hypothetical protein AAC03nite_04990 [Alicyclobacillus acidoterrestris]|nr:hypothetical protein AAC03nite_04990 [Alicyclobacillus acidoterrestris]